MTSPDVFIVSAVRTPIGNFCGSLSTLRAHELGTVVIREAVKRASIQGDDVCEVIMGQALCAGQGQNPARQASLAAGLPLSTPAYIVSMLCGSGLKSVALAYQAIRNGDADIMVAGGQESMSQAPHVASGLRDGIKMGNAVMVDTMLHDGLTDVFHQMHMGETAELIAQQYGISRDAQDAFALESQKRTANAQNSGYFSNEIVPVTVKVRREEKVVSKDEFPKPETTLEKLSKQSPAFIKEGGTVTAGNASGINDGAAAVVLVSSKVAQQKGLKPLARIVGVAQGGVDPKVMGLGPVPAVKNLLSQVGWKVEDVDLFELNEAFAAQAIACNKDLGVDATKVNVNGGAISLGHPIGASGARVLVTLVHALQQRGGKKGVTSLCIGGGMGIAMAIEAV